MTDVIKKGLFRFRQLGGAIVARLFKGWGVANASERGGKGDDSETALE